MSRRRANDDAEPGDASAPKEPATPASNLVPPIGQGAALQRHLRAARQLTMHHALVIGGPSGSGKSTIARWIAAALLCPSDLDPASPCGVCRTCRRVQSGMHPDLFVVEPEPEKREIAVDAVRALLDALLRSNHEGRARVAILDPASALNVEGQNALLKTLEEPGSATFLLLPTSRPESLLPTVRSRSERLGVRRLDDDTIAREIDRRFSVPPSLRARAVAGARGCLGAALQSCTERAVQLQDLVHAIVDLASPLRAVNTTRSVLESAEGSGGAQRVAREFLAQVRAHASSQLRALASSADGSYVARSSKPWTALLELALAAEQDLDVQIPPEQALIGMLLQWQRTRGRGS